MVGGRAVHGRSRLDVINLAARACVIGHGLAADEIYLAHGKQSFAESAEEERVV